MNKLIDCFSVMATVGASLGVAFLYACTATIPSANADTHAIVPMSMCDDVEISLCEAVESGFLTQLEADGIIQSCRNRYE